MIIIGVHMAVGHMLTIQNKGVVLYNNCLFAQCKIRLVIDYEMVGFEGHVKCCIECILMEVMMLRMEYSVANQRESVYNYSFTTPIYAQIGVRSCCHYTLSPGLHSRTSWSHLTDTILLLISCCNRPPCLQNAFLLCSENLIMTYVFQFAPSPHTASLSVCTFTSHRLYFCLHLHLIPSVFLFAPSPHTFCISICTSPHTVSLSVCTFTSRRLSFCLHLHLTPSLFLFAPSPHPVSLSVCTFTSHSLYFCLHLHLTSSHLN